MILNSIVLKWGVDASRVRSGSLVCTIVQIDFVISLILRKYMLFFHILSWITFRRLNEKDNDLNTDRDIVCPHSMLMQLCAIWLNTLSNCSGNDGWNAFLVMFLLIWNLLQRLLHVEQQVHLQLRMGEGHIIFLSLTLIRHLYLTWDFGFSRYTVSRPVLLDMVRE